MEKKLIAERSSHVLESLFWKTSSSRYHICYENLVLKILFLKAHSRMDFMRLERLFQKFYF